MIFFSGGVYLRGMPQADILSFHPTMLVLPVFFLGGYFFFATYWAPRIMLTLKARAWLTGFRALPVGFLSPGEGWPEIFLMFIQFGGLLYFISTLSLVTTPPADQKLQPLTYQPPRVASFEGVGGLPVENFFLLWGTHREGFLFRPAAVELTHLVDRVLGGFGFYAPGKQFPLLGVRLRGRLPREAQKLSSPAGGSRG